VRHVSMSEYLFRTMSISSPRWASFQYRGRRLITVGSMTLAWVILSCCQAAASEDIARLFQPPIGIESVFPASVIRKDVLRELEPVENGYEIWGREIVTQSNIPVYFSTPVSYPWAYTEEGAERLVRSLKQLSYVRSAEIKHFPTIHPQLLKHYSDLRPLAWQETYILVTLRDWSNVRLMSFPIFTVLVFEYQDPSVEYSHLVTDWKSKVEKLTTLHELRELLGLEPRLRWHTLPTLTWTHLPYYNSPDFGNRYWSGSDRSASERNSQFLRENSLVSFGTENPSNRVRHCYNISYEYHPLMSNWRFFYATGDWFLGWDDKLLPSRDPSGPEMTWSRIVRAALLVNVVLPEMVKRGSDLVETIKQEREPLISARTKAFGTFSLDAIEALHKEVGGVETRIRASRASARRIQQAIDGYESLLTFLSRPFGGPLAETFGPLKSNKGKGWECVEQFFSFQRDNRVQLNDRRKANGYATQINVNLDRLNTSLTTLQRDLSDSLSLLEARRSLLWSQKSTFFAIIWPAVGAIVAGLIWLFSVRHSREDKRSALNLLIPASGALVAGFLWWLLGS